MEITLDSAFNAECNDSLYLVSKREISYISWLSVVKSVSSTSTCSISNPGENLHAFLQFELLPYCFEDFASYCNLDQPRQPLSTLTSALITLFPPCRIHYFLSIFSTSLQIITLSNAIFNSLIFTLLSILICSLNISQLKILQMCILVNFQSWKFLECFPLCQECPHIA